MTDGNGREQKQLGVLINMSLGGFTGQTSSKHGVEVREGQC